MIEVLVALFVLSVGLLGVGAMQQVGLRNSYASHLRAQATVLAYDIGDRMRANRTVALGNAYNVTYQAFGSLPSTASACTGTGPAVRARCDLAQWREAMQRTLPGAQGEVRLQPVGPAGTQTVQIAIRWDDARDGSPLLEFRTETQL
jgi:type IV pilus assembly protein PilV